MKVTVREGKPWKDWEAQAIKHRNGNYTIIILHTMTPFQKARALRHEFHHIINWEYMPFSNEENEHKMIEAADENFTENAKQYWIGSEE